MIGALAAAAGTLFAGGRLARALFVDRPPPPPAVEAPPPDPADYDGPEIAGRTLEDWRIDGALVLSTAGVIGVGVGAALSLPTAVIVTPMLGAVVVGFVGRAVADYRRDGRVGVAGVDVFSSAGPLAAGHLTAVSTYMISVHATRRIARSNEDRTRRALGRLLAEISPTAWRVEGGVAVEVPLDALAAGDVIEVSAGQAVPVDGAVVEGLARVDRQALTGESAAGHAGPGDAVHAAELLIEGRVRVRVDRAGAETRAAQIEALLDAATGYRRRFRSQGDDVVDAGARPTLALGALALPTVGVDAALGIIFAPLAYALRYTAPISVLGYMQCAARSGILVKDGRALELVAGVDVVIFDKTGTLTDPVPRVVEVVGVGGDPEPALALAAAAERHQSHPLAAAIRAEAARRGLLVAEAEAVAVERGRGLTATVDGRRVLVGSARLLAAEGAVIETPAAARDAEARGRSVVYVAVDGALAAWIALEARPRPEAAAVIARMKARGLAVHLVSGDRPAPTAALAAALGVDHWRAEALPDEKARHITALQDAGRRVCFVGDGLNDAVALERADVAVAMGSAASLAGDLAAVVLLGDHLGGLDTLWDLGGRLAVDFERSTLLTTVPNAIVIGGALFFGLGFNAAWAMFQVGLWSSVAVAIRPVLEARRLSAPADADCADARA